MQQTNTDNRMTRKQRRLYALCVAFCILARCLSLIGTDNDAVYSRWSTVTDAGVYDAFGWNLASKGTLGIDERPSAFALPAYPLLIAGTYALVGHKPGAVRWLQVLMGVLSLIFLGRLARYLSSPRAEIILLLGGAVYPFFLYFTRDLLTETLSIFALSGLLLSAYLLGQTGKMRYGVLHGSLLAVAMLTRVSGLVVELGILLLARPWAREHRSQRLMSLSMGMLIVAVAWGGWIVRNQKVFGEIVLFDTHGGFALYTGQLFSRGLSAEEVVERVGYKHRDIELSRLPGGPQGELEADRQAGAAALEMIREDPKRFLQTLPRNTYMLWLGLDLSGAAEKGGRFWLMTAAAWGSYGPLLILAIAGAWRASKSDHILVFIGLIVTLLLFTALHSIVLGGMRYRAAGLDPILFIFAAWELDARLKENILA